MTAEPGGLLDCANHAGVPASNHCSGCAEPFCGHCLVHLKGADYCASCKTMALPPDALARAMQPCKEAGEALKYALLSFVCFGVVLGPVAVKKAFEARDQISKDPTLSGRGKANAAIFLGSTALVLWCLGMFARVTAK